MRWGRARLIGEELGMPVLVERCRTLGVVVPPAGVGGRSAGTTPEASLRREGEVWAITFEDRTTRLTDSKGMRYLAELLEHAGPVCPRSISSSWTEPPSDVPAVDRDLVTVSGRSDADPILDAAARAAYRARLVELQDDSDAADRGGDSERGSRARVEMEFLARELAAAIGLVDDRADHITDAERARQSATKAIKSAVSRITARDRRLGVHLTHAVRTGALCTYAPDPRAPLRWVVTLGTVTATPGRPPDDRRP